MADAEINVTGTEREQIEEDIERINLVLQDDSDRNESEDESLQIVEYDYVNNDKEVTEEIQQISELTEKEVEEIDQCSGIEEISQLPLNPETCLALNRTYQELILESLRKIELALDENREKQKVLEDGLQNKTSTSKVSENQGSKRRQLALYGKPYFKDKDGKNPQHNSDVTMKKMTLEQRQDVAPPPPWSFSQRRILLNSIKEEAQKHRMIPLMNRKEIYVEKVKRIENQLLEIQMEISRRKEDDEEDVKEDKKSEILKGKRRKTAPDLSPVLEKEMADLQKKIKDLDNEMQNIKNLPDNELLNDVDEEKVDWLMISNVVFNGKRDERECQIMWKNVLHPSINKEKWTTQEVFELQELVEKYCMRNWPAIAKELGTGRTPFQCLQYFQYNLNDTYNKRDWTEEEDEMLKEVVESVQIGKRISFSQVSYFLDGRSMMQCQNRWQQINPNLKRGHWDLHEDCMLVTAVQLHGCRNWSLIQEYVPHRSAPQCRDRYLNCLDPKLNIPEKWTYEDDKLLLKLAQDYIAKEGKVRWVRLLKDFPGRTDNQLIARYRRLRAWAMRSNFLSKDTDETTRRNLGLICQGEGVDDSDEEKKKKKKTKLKKKITEEHLARYQQQDVNSEDYYKQRLDKEKGDIIVPRPPLLSKNPTRCIRAIWERKKKLHELVANHVKNLKPSSGAEMQKTAVKDFQHLSSLSKQQQKMLRSYMAKDPSKITVRDMLFMSKKMNRHQNCVKERIKRFESDFVVEEEMRNILIWKCFHSLLVDKRSGRPRKFYIFNPMGRISYEEEDHEDVEQISKITVTLIMNALDVDMKSALKIYNSMKERDPYVEEDGTVLKSICSSISQPRVVQSKAADSNPVSSSTSSHPPSESLSTTLQTTSTHPGASGTVISVSSSHTALPSAKPSAGGTKVRGRKRKACETVTSAAGESIMSEKEREIKKSKTNTSEQDVIANNGGTNQVNTNSKLQISDSIVTSEGITSTDSKMTKKDGGQNQVAVNEKSVESVNGMSKESAVCSAGVSKHISGVVTVSATSAVKNTSVTTSKSVGKPVMSIPPGAKIIKLAPGVKLKPGDKIQDILAAQKAHISNSPIVISKVPNSNVPKPTASHKNNTSTAAPRKKVILCKNSLGAPDPNRIKILPPGTISTYGFKSLLLHRKYLISRADELYNRSFYKVRGEVLQKEVDLLSSKAKNNQNKEMDRKRQIDSQSRSALGLTNVMQTTEKSVVSDMAVPKTNKRKHTVTKYKSDVLAKIRKTKDYGVLQKRFQALFAWPALLSTIHPPISLTKSNDAAKEIRRQEQILTQSIGTSEANRLADFDENADEGEINEEKMDQKIKRRSRYPLLKSKFQRKRICMRKEKKEVLRQKRLEQLQVAKERRLLGVKPKVPEKKRKVKVPDTLRTSERVARKKIEFFKPKTFIPKESITLKKLSSKEKKLKNESDNGESSIMRDVSKQHEVCPVITVTSQQMETQQTHSLINGNPLFLAQPDTTQAVPVLMNNGQVVLTTISDLQAQSSEPNGQQPQYNMPLVPIVILNPGPQNLSEPQNLTALSDSIQKPGENNQNISDINQLNTSGTVNIQPAGESTQIGKNLCQSNNAGDYISAGNGLEITIENIAKDDSGDHISIDMVNGQKVSSTDGDNLSTDAGSISINKAFDRPTLSFADGSVTAMEVSKEEEVIEIDA